MPWVAAGTATINRGSNSIISLGVPTPSPINIVCSTVADTFVGHWGTIFVEVTDSSLGTDITYVLQAINLYRRNYRFDIGNTTGNSCRLRVHVTKKAAFPAYLVSIRRFTP